MPSRLCGENSVTQQVVLRLWVVTAVIFAGFVVSFGIHRALTPVSELKAWFDIGGEGNLPAGWNSLLLAVVALLCLICAALVARGAERRAWIVIGGAAAYLSIDEATVLHERLRRIPERWDVDPPTYAWVLPGLVVALIGSGILLAVGRSLPSPVGARLGASLAVYAIAVLGLEALGGVIRESSFDGLLFSVVLTAEEGLEVAACVVAIGTVVDHLNPRYEGSKGVIVGTSGSSLTAHAVDDPVETTRLG